MNNDTHKRLEDLQQALKKAETEQARVGGQLEQLESRYQGLVTSLQTEGFKTPEEARKYIETELGSLEQSKQDLERRLSPILEETS